MEPHPGRTSSPSSSRSSSSSHTIPGSPPLYTAPNNPPTSTPSLSDSTPTFSSSEPSSFLAQQEPSASSPPSSNVAPKSIPERTFRPPSLPWNFPRAPSQKPRPYPLSFGQLSPNTPTAHDPAPDPSIATTALPRPAHGRIPKRLCVRCFNVLGGYELCRGNCPPLHVRDPRDRVSRTFEVDNKAPAEEKRNEWLNLLSEGDAATYWLQVGGRRYVFLRFVLDGAGRVFLGCVERAG